MRGVFASNLLLTQGSCQALAGNKTNKTGDKINLELIQTVHTDKPAAAYWAQAEIVSK